MTFTKSIQRSFYWPQIAKVQYFFKLLLFWFVFFFVLYRLWRLKATTLPKRDYMNWQSVSQLCSLWSSEMVLGLILGYGLIERQKALHLCKPLCPEAWWGKGAQPVRYDSTNRGVEEMLNGFFSLCMKATIPNSLTPFSQAPTFCQLHHFLLSGIWNSLKHEALTECCTIVKYGEQWISLMEGKYTW